MFFSKIINAGGVFDKSHAHITLEENKKKKTTSWHLCGGVSAASAPTKKNVFLVRPTFLQPQICCLHNYERTKKGGKWNEAVPLKNYGGAIFEQNPKTVNMWEKSVANKIPPPHRDNRGAGGGSVFYFARTWERHIYILEIQK